MNRKEVNAMAIFRLNLSKTINTGTDNNCSISVEANSAYEDINENFEIAMELFNSLRVIDCHTEGKKEAE